ncbi:MAG: hypothetical protein ACI9JM_001910 [Halioglobus sp.]|jgi:hypothetical protein
MTADKGFTLQVAQQFVPQQTRYRVERVQCFFTRCCLAFVPHSYISEMPSLELL